MTQAKITHAFGIDISDGSIEIADVHERRDGLPVLTDHTRVALPPDTIVHGSIAHQKRFTEALRLALQKIRPLAETHAAITALPDSQILTRIFPLPKNAKTPSYATLQHIAEVATRTLPYRFQKPIMDWRYRTTSDDEGEITLFITEQTHVDALLHSFQEVGLTIAALDMQSLALHRSLIKKLHLNEHVAVLDMGFRTTALSIVDHTGLRYSHVFDEGSHALTEALARGLSCSLKEAERKKISLGLADPKRDPKSHGIIEEAITSLFSNVQNALAAYGHPVDRITLTGGGARLRGLRAFLLRSNSIPIERGSLWIRDDHAMRGHLGSTKIDSSHELYYAGAVGLALRGMNRYTLLHGINLMP